MANQTAQPTRVSFGGDPAAREYRTIEKRNWPRGEWDREPDKVQWTDPATGLPCLAIRGAHSGHLCGYVGVAEGHPLFQTEGEDLDVHGGVTLTTFCDEGNDEASAICHVPDEGQPERVWWFGFDCAHGGDLTGFALGARDFDRYLSSRHGTYRDLAFVQRQCKMLALQLKQVSHETPILP